MWPRKTDQRLRPGEARDRITRGAGCGLNLTYCSLRHFDCSNVNYNTKLNLSGFFDKSKCEKKATDVRETTFYMLFDTINIYNGIINGSARPENMPYVHKKKKKKEINSALFTFHKAVTLLHASRYLI